jgi:UDP-glucuronate decarboxylase
MSGTALVAGAAGCIGSHLVDRLLSDGWRVIGVDNLSSGCLPNLRSAFEEPGFKFIKADLARPVRLPPANVIFHLASPASPPRYQKDPIGTLEANGFGTSQLLALADRSKARFILGSSSEVYGDPEVHPQPEDYRGNVSSTGLRSCYDEGKRYAEALAMAWHRQKGVDVRIARIFNTYGPRMGLDDGRVIPAFLGQALAGAGITVQGRGRQSRTFCYVTDLVDGLVRLSRVKPLNGPVNLGNPQEEISMLRLAQLIRHITGSRSPIVFVPRNADDPSRRQPDIRRAHSWLGWSPTTPLREGLRRTAEYAKEELERIGKGRSGKARIRPAAVRRSESA